MNPLEHQGVIVIKPDGTTCKIVTTHCLNYKLLRGSEPDVNAAYFRLRKTDEEVKTFTTLFPKVNIKKIKEDLCNMVKYVHSMSDDTLRNNLQ